MVGSIPTPGTGGKMFKKNKDNPTLEYWTSIAGLTDIEDIRPYPLKKSMPEWWKNIPPSNFNKKTVKHCPSFMDVFSSAYVIPMWCDTLITFRDSQIFWQSPSSEYQFEFHSNEQFLSYAPKWINQEVSAVLKPISPWFAKTPKGYSVYQMPVFYDFNENFSSIPGIIHTDVYHYINPQILIFSKKKEFLIKRGTPLFIHFPFKREKFSLSVNEGNRDDAIFNRCNPIVNTKFLAGYRSFTKNFMK